MSNLTKVGSRDVVGETDSYEVLGIDWKEKKLGVPMYGWGLGLAAAAYYFFFRKKR